MSEMANLVGTERAAPAGMLRPAEHPGLEEGAVDDQLTAAFEQIDQAYLALGSVELVLLVHSQPRHPPTLRGQRVTRAGQGLLLHEELLARSLPLLLRHDRGCAHREMPFPMFLLSLFACCHLICLCRHSCLLPSSDFGLQFRLPVAFVYILMRQSQSAEFSALESSAGVGALPMIQTGVRGSKCS